ncbi:MAG TPA: RNA 3'-terminal phosphate cyclase [Myxococcota bacterium]|jgi:RNA 3'-terminal phosphate cyclase (ATP)
MKVIDGAQGEGGGQVLRTALALAALTHTDIVIEDVRANRKKPGLQRQHLAAVKAVASICNGSLRGAELGSARVELRPGKVSHGDRTIRIGTAGSTTLVVHALLPALLVTPGRSRIVVEGGTHNPLAPPFEHLERAYFPALRAMGARVQASIELPGFVPEGGGRIIVDVEGGHPLSALTRVDIACATDPRKRSAELIVWTGGAVPADVADREIAAVTAGLAPFSSVHAEVKTSAHTGNALALVIDGFDVVGALGARGRAAELVAAELVAEAKKHLMAGVPVGEHLADQLLLPLALGAGGQFLTLAPTLHSITNAAVIRDFLDVDIVFDAAAAGAVPRGAVARVLVR